MNVKLLLSRAKLILNNVILPWLKQYIAMLYKSSLILKRQLKTTISIILLPLLGLIILSISSHSQSSSVETPVNNDNSGSTETLTADHPLYSVPFDKCISLDANANLIPDSNCISILYYPQSPQIDSIMSNVANKVNLEFGSDVVGLSSGSSIESYITFNLGLVDVAIEFVDYGAKANPQDGQLNIPLYENQFNYQLYFNYTAFTITPSDMAHAQFDSVFGWSNYVNNHLDDSYQRIETLQFHLEKTIADTIAANVAKQFPLQGYLAPSNQTNTEENDNVQFKIFSVAQAELQALMNESVSSTSTENNYVVIPNNNNDSVIENGSIFTVTVPAAIIMLILIQIVSNEKQIKMLGSLRINGLNDSAYWLGWITIFIVLTFIAAMICSIGCTLSNLQTYSHTDFGIYFIMNWCFLMCMSAFALFITSLFNKPQWINFISLIIFALAIISGIFWPGNQQIYNSYSSHSTPAGYIFLSLLPWVPTAKILADIYQHSTYQLIANRTAISITLTNDLYNIYPSPSSVGYEYQRSYSWNEIYDRQLIVDSNYCTIDDTQCCQAFELYNFSYCFTTDSTSTTFGILILVTFIYLFLAWYFANIFTSEQGGNKPFYFIFTRQFWGLKDNNTKIASIGDHITEEQLKSESDESIRIIKLSKAFKNTSAVKEISLNMEKNQIFVLLGHNGAGKTTLINMLTGLIPPTFGEAFICGLSIRYDTLKLMSILGVCNQENILYQNLTCYEHLFMFGLLRNIQYSELNSIIKESLHEVYLEDAAHKYISQLSGGMKRRLMIAIALISKPKVLFLDEPTTGMDPLNRSKVWDAIQRLKKNRVVVLTTHSMEEADHLSDQIAMISLGRLRALGTSLFLKNHYGRGYQLQLLVNQNQIDLFTKIVQDYLPNAELLGTQGGNITIALKRTAVKGLPQFFRYIQQHNNVIMKTNINNTNNINNNVPSNSIGTNSSKSSDLLELKEWSISNSTLEEVFLRLCAVEKGINIKLINEQDNTNLDNLINKCSVCNFRPSETVTLFTADGLPVIVNNTICSICSVEGKQEKERKFQEEKQALVLENELDSKPLILTLDNNSSQSDIKSLSTDIIEPAVAAVSVINNQSIELTNLNSSTNLSDSHNNATDNASASSLEFAFNNKPATKFNQIRAIFLKNFGLILQEKKSWLTRTLFLLGLAIALIVISKSGSISSQLTSQNLALCRNGMIYSVVGGDKFPHGCDLVSIQNFLFGGSLITVPVDFQVASFDSGKETYSISPVYYYFAGSGEQIPTNSIYFLNSNKTDETPFDLFDLGLGPANLVFGSIWNGVEVNNLIAYGATTKFINVENNIYGATDLDSLILAYQNNLFLSQDQAALTVCSGKIPPGTVVVDSNVAYSLAITAYPALGVQFVHTALGYLDNYNAYQPGQYSYNFEFFLPGSGTTVPIAYNTYPGCNLELIQNPIAYLVYPLLTISSMINSLSNAYLWTTLHSVSNVTNLFNSLNAQSGVPSFSANVAAPKIIGTILGLPPILFSNIMAISSNRVAGVTILSFATSLIFPWFVERIIYEREKQLFYMQRLNGLKSVTYWLGNYIFDSCLLWCWSILFIILGYALDLIAFQDVSGGIYFLVFLIWNHVQLCLAIFTAGFFNKQKWATISCYLIIVLLAVYAALVEQYVAVKDLPSGLLYFPPFAYIRLLSLIINYGGSSPSSIGPNNISGFNQSIINLFFIGSACGIIGLYFNSLHYLHPLFFLDYFNTKKKSKISNSNNHYTTVNLDEANSKLDPDILKEKNRVLTKCNLGSESMSAVTILNLSKTFPAQKAVLERKAVDGLYLGIEYGEVFGLLGPNGAGKSTTLSMLTGLLKPTSGNAYLSGYDIVSELESVYSILGICPQFDIVWEDLSVRDHLLFYARLKGCPPNLESGLVQTIARMVELDGDSFNKSASSLSGGTLRRLSIGISLIGNPKIWLLDEPSTGLSVENRRDVWDIISKQKQLGRSCIITTHLMTEAETLCDRIGIMVNGQLHCIGNQSNLKNRYGSGLKLTFNLNINMNQINDVELVPISMNLQNFVQNKIWPNAVKSNQSKGKTIVFTLSQIANNDNKDDDDKDKPSNLNDDTNDNSSKNTVNNKANNAAVFDSTMVEVSEIVQLFNNLEQHKAEFPNYFILEYGLSYASLQEVFVNIVTNENTTNEEEI